jgi:hypothetical protein
MTPAHERADVKRAVAICDDWLATFGDVQPQFVPAQRWASGAVKDIRDAIAALRTSPEQSGKPDREAVELATAALRCVIDGKQDAGTTLAFARTAHDFLTLSSAERAEMTGEEQPVGRAVESPNVRTPREALAFYADPWAARDEYGEPVTIPDFYSELDFGRHAREALALPAPPPSTSPEARAPEELRAWSEKAPPGPWRCYHDEDVWLLDGNGRRIWVNVSDLPTTKLIVAAVNYVRSLLQRGDHGER